VRPPVICQLARGSRRVTVKFDATPKDVSLARRLKELPQLRSAGSLVSPAAVEGLPNDVRMAGVPGRLLDHVQQDPSQVAVCERGPGAGRLEVPLSSDLTGDGGLLVKASPGKLRPATMF
jgi:hypothetical protein